MYIFRDETRPIRPTMHPRACSYDCMIICIRTYYVHCLELDCTGVVCRQLWWTWRWWRRWSAVGGEGEGGNGFGYSSFPFSFVINDFYESVKDGRTDRQTHS